MSESLLKKIARKMLTGIIRKTDDQTTIQKTQTVFLANDVWENINTYQPYGFTHHVHPGAHAIGLFINDNNGLVLCASDPRYRMKNLKVGEVALYDSLGNFLYLKRNEMHLNAVNQWLAHAANTIIFKTKTLTIEAETIELKAQQLSVNANTTFTGSVTANGKKIDDTHIHPAGSPPGTTGPPV